MALASFEPSLLPVGCQWVGEQHILLDYPQNRIEICESEWAEKGEIITSRVFLLKWNMEHVAICSLYHIRLHSDSWQTRRTTCQQCTKFALLMWALDDGDVLRGWIMKWVRASRHCFLPTASSSLALSGTVGAGELSPASPIPTGAMTKIGSCFI